MTLPIVFNGVECSVMRITPSAKKHWGERTEEIYSHIFSTLDGQNRKPEAYDRDGVPCFPLASNVGIDPSVPQMIRPFRSTVFRFHQNDGVIEFFHGCPREPKWFSKVKNYQKVRQE